jgi:hypothetical protein
MTVEPLTSLDGFESTNVTLHVPAVGVWVLTCIVSDDEFQLSERQVTATIGKQSLVGTIDMAASGEFVATKKVRVIGGAAGWRKPVERSSYHNDAGVKRQTLAVALAKATGETLGDSLEGTVGSDFAWIDGVASKILEGVAPEWRVGYDGKTYLGAPPVVDQGEGIEALDYDKHAQTLTLGVYEVIPCPGMQITDERFGTVTIRSLTLTASGNGIQASAWFGEVGGSRLAAAVKALVQSSQRGLFGRYRYRVVTVGVDKRLNLQAVKSDLGLPDLQLVSQTPGLPGWESEPRPGSVAHVQFLDGDPTLPTVVGFDKNTPTISAFGGGDQPFARVGDMVQVMWSPGDIVLFTGTVDGAAATGTITPTIPITLIGIISTGVPELMS